jgi:hypothetical protein
MSLSPPQNLDLPYFAYGLFQAGELCHPRIEPFLSVAPVSDRIHGSLLVRDGLPLVSLHAGNGYVEGSVLHFRVETRRDAYQEVTAFEPSAHYRWADTTTIVTGLRVNLLVISSPNKGHPEQFEGSRWSHREDPVFRDGLRVVSEMAHEFGKLPFKSSPPDAFDWPRFFRLQMAYLLLWAGIERYTVFAFGPRLEPMARVEKLGDLATFQAAVRSRVTRRSVVTDSRTLKSYRLDRDAPAEAALYYYQVRSNLSHRGKGAWNDGELVRESLRELLSVFKKILGV